MRLGRIFASLTAAAVAVPLLPAGAGADDSSFPPAIDVIVNGNVEEFQWMLPAVNAEEAHTVATGSGVTVAVIDTGVDNTHPDLEASVVPGAYIQRNEETEKFELVPATTPEETGDDWYGHGTHVAGVVAGDDDGDGITGIAPDASIMPIHTFPRREWLREIQFWKLVTESIDYSVANGADVINMSLGGQSSGIVPSDRTQKYLDTIAALCDAVDAAHAAGTVVVASAGNSGAYGNPEQVPGSCDGTFTVAAMAPSLDRTYWSSFDAAVDVIAPGENVLSADSTVAENSDTPHLIASGTSMASPLVAGVAALLIEQHPAWTPEQVQDQITSTTKDLGVDGRDPQYGWGLVDAAAAVGAAAPTPKKQNYFDAWYETSWGGDNGEAVISWNVPAADPVTGYTVKVYTDTTTSTYDVDGNTVRENVLLPPGAWFTVTAHTTAGDVMSYPRDRYSRDRGESLPKLDDAKTRRDGDKMVITWDRPSKKEQAQIDKIRAVVHFEGRGGGAGKRIVIDHDQPFPASMIVKLSPKGRWTDAHVHLAVSDEDDDGQTIARREWIIKPESPALYGSHVRSIDRAGPGRVEVTGGMSRMNMKRVCGKDNCAGESAVLVVDRGKKNQRMNVVFTEKGVFHKMVGYDKGTEFLRLRIEGPKNLSSGPFQRFAIGKEKGDDPCSLSTGPTGC
ncbi:MAG TPA: S8 family serine peptidase [Actinomycetes bacterium]|nr:S8 family serine peptidase [Actinomycetes bacterium]